MKHCTEPLTVSAENGYVLVEGGCGVSVTLSPNAALDTGEHMISGAATAQGQRHRHLGVTTADIVTSPTSTPPEPSPA